MIQRKQTLFILAAMSILGIMFFKELAVLYTNTGEEFLLFLKGVKTAANSDVVIFSTLPLFLLVVIMISLSFISIFLYKRRMLQVRFMIYNMILLFAQIGGSVIYLFLIKKEMNLLSYKMTYVIIFPVIALVLMYMAMRAIRKDEALVKAADRLR